MKNFTALYMMPAASLAAWMERPEADRKGEDEKLMSEWNAWLAANSGTVMKTIGLGKTKRVSANGVEDVKNDLMLSSYVSAESLDAAAALFATHPHLKLPGATIEIMEANEMKGM